MLNYSRKLTNEAKTAKIDINVKAMADLMSIGWKAVDAFIAVGLQKVSLSDKYNTEQLEGVLNDHHFRDYLDKQQTSLKRKRGAYNKKGDEEEESDRPKTLTKEDILTELKNLLDTMDKKDPKRAEILMKYSDLQRYKQEEVKEEDTTVHFYLPLWCKECALYQQAQETQNS